MSQYTYSTENGLVRIGSCVGKTSSGQLILEDVETGEVITVDKKQAKEVMPYLAEIEYVQSGCRTFNIPVREGTLKEDIIVLVQDSAGYLHLGRVKKLSRSKKSVDRNTKVFTFSSDLTEVTQNA